MLTRIREALYRWRVRRALSPRNVPKGWPLFIVLAVALVGCAHRHAMQAIHATEAACLERIGQAATEAEVMSIQAECRATLLHEGGE